MLKIKSSKDLARLARVALAAQGLLSSQPYGRGISGTRNTIQHLGYIQIDTISVVERAHNHVLYSRVPGFKPEMLNKLLVNRDVFEYWSHAAAFLPIDDYRFSLPYKQAIRSGQVHWYKTRDQKLMNELVTRIRAEGPLRSRDIESGSEKRAGWWDWKPAKKALEQLFMEGELMVSNREGFQKCYDLTENVLPNHIDTRSPTAEEFAEHLLQQQLRCHGLVSLKGLTYLRRNAELKKAVKSLVQARLDAKDLEQLQLPNGELYLIEAGGFEQKLTRLNNRLQILSPFDNAVIQRDRLKSLFNYDYQIECYVPAAKRQYGYFCLPLLYRGEFVGRMDCKAHRKLKQLEIKALHLESDHSADEQFANAFADAVKQFCEFQNCDSVTTSEPLPEWLSIPFHH